MLIDTHCHLNDTRFAVDLNSVIANAKKAGVKKIIVPAYDYRSSQRSLDLRSQFPDVIYSAIGLHPYEAQHVKDISVIQKFINQELKTKNREQINIVAIGECGLDYHQYKGFPAVGKKDYQKSLFEEQCLLALKFNLPVIIHSRDAYPDIFDVLDSLPSMPRAVLHCFSGGLQEVRFAQKRNLFIGLDCNITYSKQLQQILPDIPQSMMLLETDSPYLPPINHRGERNEPKYLRHAADKIAEILKISVGQVTDLTSKNCLNLFNVS